MRNIDILIENGVIVTMDSQRTIIDNSSIAINKDKIVGIGSVSEFENDYNAKEILRL